MQGIGNTLYQGGQYLYNCYDNLTIKLQDNCCPEAMTEENIHQLVPKALRGKFSVTVDPTRFNDILKVKQPNYDQEYVNRKFKALPLAFCHAVLLNVVILVQIVVLSIVVTFGTPLYLPHTLPAPYGTAYDNFMINLFQNPIQKLRNGDIKGFLFWLARVAAVLTIAKIALPYYATLGRIGLKISGVAALGVFVFGGVIPAIGSNLLVGLGYLFQFFSKDDRPALRFIHIYSLERSFHFNLMNFDRIQVQKINLIQRISTLAKCRGAEVASIFSDSVYLPQKDRITYVRTVANFFIKATPESRSQASFDQASTILRCTLFCLDQLETNLINSITNGNILISERKAEEATKNVKELKETYAKELLNQWLLDQTERLNQLRLNPSKDPNEENSCRRAGWLFASISYSEGKQLQINFWENAIKYLQVKALIEATGSEEEKFYAWHHKVILSLVEIFKEQGKELEILITLKEKLENYKKLEKELEIGKKLIEEHQISKKLKKELENFIAVHKNHEISKKLKEKLEISLESSIKLIPQLNRLIAMIEEPLKGLCKFLIENPHLSKDFQVQYPTYNNTLETVKIPEENAENFLNLAVLMEISYQTGQWSLYAKDFIQKNLLQDIYSLNYSVGLFNKNSESKQTIPKAIKNQIIGAMFLNQFRKEKVLYPREIPISLNNAIENSKVIKVEKKVEEEKIN